MVLNDTEIFKKLSVVLEAEFALIQSTYLFYSHVQKLLHKSLSIGLYFSKPCETASAAIKLKFTFFFVKRIGHDRVFFFLFHCQRSSVFPFDAEEILPLDCVPG